MQQFIQLLNLVFVADRPPVLGASIPRLQVLQYPPSSMAGQNHDSQCKDGDFVATCVYACMHWNVSTCV